MFSFLRRQYLLGRYYAPRWWQLGCATTLLSNLALVPSLGLFAWGLVASAPTAWMASGVCAALYVLHVLRGLARQSLVQIYCPELAGELRKPGRFDIWAGPLVSAVNLAVLLSSAVGRTMTWRGITYCVLSNGHARILHRETAPGEEPHGGDQAAQGSRKDWPTSRRTCMVSPSQLANAGRLRPAVAICATLCSF